jgi:hypothetical protein
MSLHDIFCHISSNTCGCMRKPHNSFLSCGVYSIIGLVDRDGLRRTDKTVTKNIYLFLLAKYPKTVL